MNKLYLSTSAVVLGLLMMWMGCATKKMPEAELIGIRYTNTGTMAGYIFEGEMMKDANGDIVLRAMKESYGPLFEKHLTADEVSYFRQIMEEEKMYDYKERYLPKWEVLDGESWMFTAKFADGSSIDTHGSNAWPQGNGLERIRSYMEQLVQDGVQIEEIDE